MSEWVIFSGHEEDAPSRHLFVEVDLGRQRETAAPSIRKGRACEFIWDWNGVDRPRHGHIHRYRIIPERDGGGE